VGPLHDPAGAGLDGGGDALAGDLAVRAQLIEQLVGHGAVIARSRWQLRFSGRM